MVICLTSCGTANAEKLIGVEFSGFNEHGTASVKIDDKAASAVLDRKKISNYLTKLKSRSSNSDSSLDLVFEIEYYYETGDAVNLFYDLDFEGKHDNLSNGDKVVVVSSVNSTFENVGETRKSIEKGSGIKVPERMEFTVEGLGDIKTVDILKDIEKCVSFNGANRHGKAQISVPGDFQTQIGDLTISQNNSYYGDASSSLKLTCGEKDLGTLSLELDKAENLNKGDTVTVSFDPESATISNLKNAGFYFSADKKEITVPDLGDATELDVLGKISKFVKYTGANGYGSAYIEIPEDTNIQIGGVYLKGRYKSSVSVVYDNTDIGYIEFNISSDKDLKNGSKVYLTVDSDSTAIEPLHEKNMYLKEDEKEITVPDLGSYINAKNELTKTDIATIKKMAMENAAANNSSKTVKFEAMYFGTIKPDAATSNRAKGKIIVVYSYVDMIIFGNPNYCYRVVVYNDIHKTSDGNIMVDKTNNDSIYIRDDDVSTVTERLDSNYSYEKIG
jgi:hypothetical protein